METKRTLNTCLIEVGRVDYASNNLKAHTESMIHN